MRHSHTLRNMKKAILLLLAAGFFSTSYGQDKALLYEVSGKGLPQASYLYGTFHLVCPADLKFSPATTRAINEARQLYLEIDVDDPALQSKLMGSMMLAGGKSLKDVMNADDYTALDRYLVQSVGVGLAQLGMLKPVALLGLVYQGLLQCEPASYDLKFAELAGRDKKEVLGLETIEQQVSAFDTIPLQDQVKDLVDLARKPDVARRELAALVAAYNSQDLPQLMKLVKESQFEDGTQKFEDELLSKRNSSWIPVIEKAAHDKSTFFAFGAAHLGGPAGVISLLRQKGYSVKPLP